MRRWRWRRLTTTVAPEEPSEGAGQAKGVVPPLSGSMTSLVRLLPHNDFPPEEIAGALDLLMSFAGPATTQIEVEWRKDKTARQVSTAELRGLTDPERVVRIRVKCPSDGDQASAVSPRFHGDLVRPETWGIRRRGRLTVEGGGPARASLNAAMAYLAACRPGTAAVRRGLTGPVPLFAIVVAVGIGFVITSVAVLNRPEAPTFFSRTTLAVYGVDAVLAVLYYVLAWSFFGGTRVVEPAVVMSRSWLTPAVVTGVIGLLVAGTALFAPAISAVVAVVGAR